MICIGLLVWDVSASCVKAQKRTAEYRITNNERRRKPKKGFDFIIRNSLFDILHSSFGVLIEWRQNACIRP
jgi:hypothetical protein